MGKLIFKKVLVKKYILLYNHNNILCIRENYNEKE